MRPVSSKRAPTLSSDRASSAASIAACCIIGTRSATGCSRSRQQLVHRPQPHRRRDLLQGGAHDAPAVDSDPQPTTSASRSSSPSSSRSAARASSRCRSRYLPAAPTRKARRSASPTASSRSSRCCGSARRRHLRPRRVRLAHPGAARANVPQFNRWMGDTRAAVRRPPRARDRRRHRQPDAHAHVRAIATPRPTSTRTTSTIWRRSPSRSPISTCGTSTSPTERLRGLAGLLRHGRVPQRARARGARRPGAARTLLSALDARREAPSCWCRRDRRSTARSTRCSDTRERYTRAVLRESLESAGFEVEHVFGFNRVSARVVVQRHACSSASTSAACSSRCWTCRCRSSSTSTPSFPGWGRA